MGEVSSFRTLISFVHSINICSDARHCVNCTGYNMKETLHRTLDESLTRRKRKEKSHKGLSFSGFCPSLLSYLSSLLTQYISPIHTKLMEASPSTSSYILTLSPLLGSSLIFLFWFGTNHRNLNFFHG